jgi:aspartate kinase
MALEEKRPVVHKYGGSSLSSIGKLRAVARKVATVRRSGHPVVVVVSAMGRTTNALLEQARQISGDPDPRELDRLLACGERVSTALLAMAIREEGTPAISLSGPESGIATDTQHLNARVVCVRPQRVKSELRAGRVAVVAGFQGEDHHGELTTLGRGGSDTTAVVLAGALNASVCEIYSDVPGVYTADPRLVAEPLHLRRVGSRLMSEYARHGARVLHWPCLDHARTHGITIRALSTFEERQGTTIAPDGGVEYHQDCHASLPRIVGVSSRRRRLRVHAGPAVDVEAITGQLADYETAFRNGRLGNGRDHVDVLVDGENAPNPGGLAEELRARLNGLATVTPDLATISAVAEPAELPDLAHRMRDALRAAGAPVVSIYRRPLSITCAVPDQSRVGALQAVHDSLMTPRPVLAEVAG